MRKKLFYFLQIKRVLFSLLFSVAIAWGYKNALTVFLLGGKSFAGRSLIGQIGVVGTITLFAFILFLFTFYLLELFFSKYGKLLEQRLKLIGFQVNQIILKPYIWILPLLSIIVFLVVQIRLISFPYELEYREGAVLLTTEGLLRGINPYILENNPVYINVYGVVYNLFVLPLAFLFGNTLALHRLVSALFTFCQVALVVLILRREKTSWLLSIIAGLFIWLSQIASTSPLARPDTLGEFLFLMSLFVPYLYGFSPLSITWGIVFGIVGFYTKPYFIVGLPILIAYIFLFISKKQAFFAGLLSLIGFVITVLLVNKLCEAYFLNTIYSHIAEAGNSIPYLLQQTYVFIQNYWSILLISGLALTSFIVKTDFRMPSKALSWDIKDFSKSLLTPTLNFSIFCLIPTSFLIIFSMGRHTGAVQIYFYQLLTPFVVISFMPWLNSMDWQKGLAILLVIINLVTHSFQTLASDVDLSVKPGWSQLSYALSKYSHILNSPVGVSILTAKNQSVVDSGQTWYYRKLPPNISWLSPDPNRFKQVDHNFVNSIQNGISQKHFDLIMFDRLNKQNIDTNLVQTYYQQDGEVTVEMPHTSQVWKIELWIPK